MFSHCPGLIRLSVGTAEWEGVTLKSVLKYCGGVGINGKGKFENGKMAHCELHGADTYVWLHRIRQQH